MTLPPVPASSGTMTGAGVRPAQPERCALVAAALYAFTATAWLLLTEHTAEGAAGVLIQDGLLLVGVTALGLYLGIRHFLAQVTERAAACEATAQAYRAFFEFVPDAVWFFDTRSRRIVAANPAAGRLYGRLASQMEGADVATVLADSTSAEWNPGPCLLGHRLADGTIRALDTTLYDQVFAGHPCRVVYVQEAAISRALPNRLEPSIADILDKVPLALYRYGAAHEHYDYVSARMTEWLGVSADALGQPGGWKHFAERVPDDDLGALWARIDAALAQPGTGPVDLTVTYRLHTAGGALLHIQDAMTLLRNPDGSLRAIAGAASDHTAAQQAGEYLGVTLRSIGDGVIATNAAGNITLMNTAACVLTGWTEQDAVGKPLRVVLHLEPPTDGPASDRGLPRQIRLVDRVGEVRTVACCRTPIRGSASDLPLGEVIVLHDLKDERTVRDSAAGDRARYLALVENSPVGILRFSRDLRIVYCNTRLATLFRSTPDQLVGLDLHGLEDDTVLATLRDVLSGQPGAYDGPFRSTMLPAPLNLSIRVTPELDADGEVIGGIGTVEDRTAFLETEAQLRDTRERYVLAQRGTNEGLWDWDPRTRHLYLSARLLSLLGLTSDTLRTSGQEWQKLIHPDDRPHVRADFIAHLRGRTEHFESEYRIADKDGRYHWVHARGLAHRNRRGRPVRVVGSIGDITARKQAEEQLKAERDFSRSLIDSLPAPFFLFDQAGRLVLWNSFVKDLTGLSDDELHHAEVEKLVVPEQEPILEHRLQVALTSGQASAEVLLRRRDKDPVPFLVVGRRVILDGVPHIIGVATDLTERKFAERAIKRLNTELERRVNERTSQLSAALSELESFSYSVSHDLRAPLRAIEGYSTILGSDYADRLDDEAKELLRRVRAAVHRMGQLIDDLLTLSRVSRKELERRPVDLSLLAQAICDELRQQEPGRHVIVEIAPDLKVDADPSLMRTVLENLLGNAWKFTGRVEVPEIRFSAVRHEGMDAFVVQDNGAGFDMRYRENLFRPFQRLHSDREFPGTGIGLATVARIVRRHGGQVWAEGEVGKGAALYFSIGQS